MRLVRDAAFSDFEWDEAKRKSVLEVRGIDFADVAAALLEPHLEQQANSHQEERTKAICRIETGIVRTIFTMRGTICRIITAMAARRDERRAYREILGG